MSQETLQKEPSLLDQIRIVDRREDDLIEAYVPIRLIYREDVPVDSSHVTELANSMVKEKKARNRKTSGQNSPVSLGEILDFDKFPIIDGFHRVAALDEIQEKEVYATVRLNSTWEDVIDQRILAAATHRSVRFARIVEWIEEAWDYSPWSERINAMQAFNLNSGKNMTGARIGLSPEDSENVKTWVERKCEQWGISSVSVYNHLTISQMAAPELVKETRERKSGRVLEAVTPQHLKAIVTILPYKHDIQTVVAETAKSESMTVPRTRAMALSVVKAKNADEARAIIESRSWNTLEAIYSSSRKRALRREVEKMSGEVTNSLIESLFEDEIKIAELLIENAILAGRYAPAIDLDRTDSAAPRINEDETENIIKDLNLIVKDIDIQDEKRQELSQDQMDVAIAEMYNLQPNVVSLLYVKFGIDPNQGADYFSEAVMKALIEMRRGRIRIFSNGILNKNGLKAWTFRVAVNSAIQNHRRSLKEKSLDNVLETKGEKGLRDITEHKDNNEMAEVVKNMLPYLSEKQRRMLILTSIFSLHIRDISQILSATEVDTRVTLHKARKRMTELLVKGI